MPRIINHRTFFYTAICVLIGSFLSALFCRLNILAVILFIILIGTNISLFIIFRKQFKYSLGFAIGAVALIVMLILTALTVDNRHAALDYDASHRIQGTVYTVQTEAGECDFIIDTLVIDGLQYSGKMRIYAEVQSEDKLEFLREGDNIEVNAKIYKYELLGNGLINAYSASNDLRYVIYTQSDDISFTSGSTGIIERLRNSLQSSLTGFMGNHYGNIAYGMITGERSGINTLTSTYFGIAGIGHILAVSGLHMGFLVGLLALLMKRVSPKIKAPIIFIILLLYALFVGFSPSVVRAVIMSSVCLVTLINGQRSDILNNLSLAFTIIIAMSPFTLFDASFLMSFSAVFGIACFSNTLTHLFAKCKIPRIVSSAMSIVISAQIGIIPCLLYFFHSLPLYSILLNIILMPVITLCFMLLFVICIVFIPFSIAAPLVIPQSLLIILDGAAQFAASLPFAQITVYTSSAIFLLFPLYFAISPYVMLSKFKWILGLCAAIGCSVICAVSVTNFDIDNAVIPVSAYNDVTSIIHKDNKVILVGDCRNGKQISRTLHLNRLGKIDVVYLTSMSSETAEAILYLRDMGECGVVYCPYGKEGEGMTKLLENDVQIYIFDQSETPQELNAEYSNNDFVGYSIALTHEKKLLFVGTQTQYSKLDISLLNTSSVIRCRFYDGYLSDRIFLTNFTIDSIDISDEYVYPIMNMGNYVFDYENGKLYI